MKIYAFDSFVYCQKILFYLPHYIFYCCAPCQYNIYILLLLNLRHDYSFQFLLLNSYYDKLLNLKVKKNSK